MPNDPIHRPAPARRSLAEQILSGPILRDPDQVDTRLQPLSWPVWRTPAPAMLLDRSVPWPGAWRDPGRPFPAFRRWPRLAAAMIARAFWMAGYPCCARQRYGHHFLAYRTIAMIESKAELAELQRSARLTTALRALDRLESIEPDELVVARLEHEWGLLVQRPPQPCPTCGSPPPRWLRKRWANHVRRHR